jgi:hypothetical protein
VDLVYGMPNFPACSSRFVLRGSRWRVWFAFGGLGEIVFDPRIECD